MEVTNVDIKTDQFGIKTYSAYFIDSKGVWMSAMYQTNGWNYPHISKDEWVEMIKE